MRKMLLGLSPLSDIGTLASVAATGGEMVTFTKTQACGSSQQQMRDLTYDGQQPHRSPKHRTMKSIRFDALRAERKERWRAVMRGTAS